MAQTLSISRRYAIAGLAAIATGACTLRASSKLQARTDLYACDGCDEAFRNLPPDLGPRSVIASQNEPGERSVAEGTVYKPDGVTPAGGVIIYAHQTNDSGLYKTNDPAASPQQREQMLRGWAKTGADGRYRFETIKPAPYPSMTMPAHIHLYIAEPGQRSYYVDDIVFAGEFGVDPSYIARQELRGGSGIVRLTSAADGTLLARRNIVLERHP
ncbi:hypothetical protein [Altererythrobacter aquiaggeris]|uniref:dioxygenase family protein n=1 Tax=Aestuarierythrobacter aquiaggeris TaxID=1898396 RepID=UPI00301B069B